MAPRRIVGLRRRSGNIRPKRKFLLICEGLNTEPLYFRAIQSLFSDALIQIDAEGGAGDPQKIAETAVKAAKRRVALKKRGGQDSFEKGDEIWAVFDRDEHPRFNEAVNTCTQAGIPIARSNPCFEVWLILHKADFDRPYDRHAVQRHLVTLCPEYKHDGSKSVDAQALLKGLADAEDRAEKQKKNRDSERNPFGAPSTTVFELIRSIRRAAKRS